jgi:PmbA protein
MEINPKELLKKAEKEVDYAQINYTNSVNDYVISKNNAISNCVSDVKSSFIMRVWIDGKEGFSYGNKPSLNVLKDAIKIAKLNAKKDYFYGLPSKSTYNKTNNFDKRILEMDASDLVDESKKLIKEVKGENNKVSLVEGDIQKSITTVNVINSNGVEGEYSTTDYAAYIKALSSKSTGYDDSEHKSHFFNIEDFASRVRRRANLFENPVSLPKEYKKSETTVVLNTECFSDLMSNAFLDGLNAQNIINKNSLFIDKLNENVAGKLSIYDDALYSKGVNSRPFDSEGTSSKKTTLIDKGILKSYICDYNTGKKLNMKSTGNAADKGIDFNNIIVDGPYNKLDKFLVIDSIIGAHTSNSLTTDFSVSIERAYLYDNGNKKPVNKFMISGKMTNFLKNIISVDKKIKHRSSIYSGSVATTGLSIN